MNYEAVLIDPERGHHSRGTGPNPVAAATAALRKFLAFGLDERHESKVQQIGPKEAVTTLCMVSVEDEYIENPRTLKEDVHDLQILVRRDPTQEVMYTPTGYIRPIL